MSTKKISGEIFQIKLTPTKKKNFKIIIYDIKVCNLMFKVHVV